MNQRQILDLLTLRGNEVQEIHLGLHRISAILEDVGNPHNSFAVLHIAGTNGKGSVAALAESILRHAGYKTGLFTSPHLERVQERMRVNGREIAKPQLAHHISTIRRRESSLLRRGRLDHQLTYFEFVTACTLLHFASAKIDVAIIEVGLGGRLDATNVVNPQACAITSISHDHMDLLGTTLTQIAREKAGIIKQNVPVVSGATAPAARRVISRCAHRAQAPLIEVDRDCVVHLSGQRNGRYALELRTPRRVYRSLRLSLAGEHQVRNAIMAICAVEAIEAFPASVASVRRALATTQWPGRLDLYAANKRTLLDAAHNSEGALLLRDYLRGTGEVEIHLVFGSMREKDILRIGKVLFPLARSIHLTPIMNPRTAEPRDIAALHKKHIARMSSHEDSKSALRAAWKECSRDGLVLVTGSIYLIGEVLSTVKKSASRLRIADR